MPIKLHELQGNERTCTLDYEGEQAQITYLPAAYTPEVEDQMQSAMESSRPSSGLARLLDGLLISWEVLDDEGNQVEPNYENMRGMPSAFLAAVVNTVTTDMQSSREERKNSGAGSQRRGSLVNARHGTR